MACICDRILCVLRNFIRLHLDSIHSIPRYFGTLQRVHDDLMPAFIDAGKLGVAVLSSIIFLIGALVLICFVLWDFPDSIKSVFSLQIVVKAVRRIFQRFHYETEMAGKNNQVGSSLSLYHLMFHTIGIFQVSALNFLKSQTAASMLTAPSDKSAVAI